MFSLLSEVESVDSFLVVSESLSDRAYNSCFRITTQSRLQYASQLRIAVVYKTLASICETQLINDIGESEQAAVDIGAFPETKTVCLGLGSTLTTS